ncbi:MAG: UDP-N-acetylmuramoyl-L-alanine--D-glutamate ligase [Alphaproteobacteria bacterium]
MQQKINSFNGNTVAILGLGRTGIAAIHALLAGGADILAFDDYEAGLARAQQHLKPDQQQIEFHHASRDFAQLQTASALILSPGIPQDHPLIKEAQRLNIPRLSDIDLLYLANPQCHFIGITGTNGKSTTTALIAHCLSMAGFAVAAGGNLGVAALNLPPLAQGGVYVLELSSYQLETIKDLKLAAGVILNITPDHLDYHKSLDNYAAAKAKLLDLMLPDGLALLGNDDALTQKIFNSKAVASTPYQLKGLAEETLPAAAQKTLGQLEYLPGDHNQQNIKACYFICAHLGMNQAQIIQGIQGFRGLDHRLQKVAHYGKIRFYNDSKATNPESAAKALACFDDIFWIAGGLSKQGAYDVLTPHFENIKQVFLIGDAAHELDAFINRRIETHHAISLSDAIEQAWHAAFTDNGDHPVILLSPACASFDAYEDFEHRGRDFIEKLKVIAAARPDLAEDSKDQS